MFFFFFFVRAALCISLHAQSDRRQSHRHVSVPPRERCTTARVCFQCGSISTPCLFPSFLPLLRCHSGRTAGPLGDEASPTVPFTDLPSGRDAHTHTHTLALADTLQREAVCPGNEVVGGVVIVQQVMDKIVLEREPQPIQVEFYTSQLSEWTIK